MGRALELQGSVICKGGRKENGRKSFWSEKNVNELIDIICEGEYYRKKLIFTNNKAVKNSEIYCKVVNKLPYLITGSA